MNIFRKVYVLIMETSLTRHRNLISIKTNQLLKRNGQVCKILSCKLNALFMKFEIPKLQKYDKLIQKRTDKRKLKYFWDK